MYSEAKKTRKLTKNFIDQVRQSKELVSQKQVNFEKSSKLIYGDNLNIKNLLPSLKINKRNRRSKNLSNCKQSMDSILIDGNT